MVPVRRLHTGETVASSGWELAEKIWREFGIEALAKYFNIGFFDQDATYGVGANAPGTEYATAREELGRFIAARQAEADSEANDLLRGIKSIPIIGPVWAWFAETGTNLLTDNALKEEQEREKREQQLGERHVPLINQATLQADSRQAAVSLLEPSLFTSNGSGVVPRRPLVNARAPASAQAPSSVPGGGGLVLAIGAGAALWYFLKRSS